MDREELQRRLDPSHVRHPEVQERPFETGAGEPGAPAPGEPGDPGLPPLPDPGDAPPPPPATDTVEQLLSLILQAVRTPHAHVVQELRAQTHFLIGIRRREGNLPGWTVRRVRVVTAGSPVQGPDIDIPHGFALVVRQRHHNSDRTGFVADSLTNARSAALRSELINGETLSLRVMNMNEVWVDADSNTTDFEFIVEQE